MNANAKEEELQQRLERIRVQNAELLQRYQEVEADKRRAARSKALVGNHVTTNVRDMMPAERDALLEKQEPRSSGHSNYENISITFESNSGNQKTKKANQSHQWNRNDAAKSRTSHANHSKENHKKTGHQRNSRGNRATKPVAVNHPPPVKHVPKVVQQTSRADVKSDGEDDDEDCFLFRDVAPLEADPVIARAASREIYSSSESLTGGYSETSASSHVSVGRPAPASEQPKPVGDLVPGYFQQQGPFHRERHALDAEASVPVSETQLGIVNRRSYSPTEGSTVPNDLQFVHNDFSVPPPSLPKSFRDPPPTIYGSGRLHTANFYKSGEPQGFLLMEGALPRYRQQEHQNMQPSAPPNLPSHRHQSEAPLSHHAVYQHTIHPTANAVAVHPSNSRLPDSLTSSHPGYPDLSHSPELPQGNAQSYNAASSMPQGFTAPNSGRLMGQDVYSSTSGAFGGQFSAMGLPSINQMAQALDAMGEQKSQRHSNANYLDNNPNKGRVASYNSMPPDPSNQQEVVLNIAGMQIPKTKAEELLKKTLAIAYAKSNLQPQSNVKDMDLNFENENSDSGMELLNIILQSSNCDEPRPLMGEQRSTNACAPVDVDRFAQIKSGHVGHGDVRGYRPVQQGVSRPLLGRGAGDQQASGIRNPGRELECESQFPAYNFDSVQVTFNQDGHRAVFGREPPHFEMSGQGRERAGSNGRSRPILGRGATDENRTKEELNGRREFREPKANPRHAVRDSESDSKLEISDVEPQSASSDESSASLHCESSGRIANENTIRQPPQQRNRNEGTNKQAHAAPTKKKSALQARMDAVRNETSKRFSRSHHISKGGVVQLSFKGHSFEVGGATAPVLFEGDTESQRSSGVEFEGEQEQNALDVHIARYKELREVGRPYGGSSEPSRKPNSSRVNAKSAMVPQNDSNFLFACADVREKDKEVQSRENFEDQEEFSDGLIQELTDKKSKLEEALEETKNENIMMEKQLKELRLQKNRVN